MLLVRVSFRWQMTTMTVMTITPCQVSTTNLTRMTVHLFRDQNIRCMAFVRSYRPNEGHSTLRDITTIWQLTSFRNIIIPPFTDGPTATGVI